MPAMGADGHSWKLLVASESQQNTTNHKPDFMTQNHAHSPPPLLTVTKLNLFFVDLFGPIYVIHYRGEGVYLIWNKNKLEMWHPKVTVAVSFT